MSTAGSNGPLPIGWHDYVAALTRANDILNARILSLEWRIHELEAQLAYHKRQPKTKAAGEISLTSRPE